MGVNSVLDRFRETYFLFVKDEGHLFSWKKKKIRSTPWYIILRKNCGGLISPQNHGALTTWLIRRSTTNPCAAKVSYLPGHGTGSFVINRSNSLTEFMMTVLNIRRTPNRRSLSGNIYLSDRPPPTRDEQILLQEQIPPKWRVLEAMTPRQCRQE